jgi:magnesium transporter
MAFQITPEYIKALRQHLEDKNFSGLESLLLDLHAADVAEIAQSLDADQAFALMQTLGSERFSDVIVYFDEERRGEILENFTGKEIAQVVVDNMDTDDAADLISELPEEKKREVLSNLEDLDLAKDLADLLTHAEGTAGALMATELVKVNENWTVLRCVREMRRQAEDVDVVHAVYVVDDNDVLLGSLSLKKLLTTSTRTPSSE